MNGERNVKIKKRKMFENERERNGKIRKRISDCSWSAAHL